MTDLDDLIDVAGETKPDSGRVELAIEHLTPEERDKALAEAVRALYWLDWPEGPDDEGY